MDLIILQDGLYHLYSVTKTMFQAATKPEVVDCFNLCEILREQLTTYVDSLNIHIMNNGSGNFYGCVCS